MILEALALLGIALAAIPAGLFLWNLLLFQRTPIWEPDAQARVTLDPCLRGGLPNAISVLIPARNEEQSIRLCVLAALASRHVELEVIVLDDHSEDRTAEMVRAIGDPRIRIESAPPLPTGWNGKQHACFVLSGLARFPILTFLDADVRLEPDGLARMAAFLEQSRAGLVSGFPRQETGTFLEKLLIPLINWVLLSYLPLWGMRHSRWSAFGAGCGQLFLATRDAYEKSGGHAAVRDSMHDGVTLPRAFRRAGINTDLCDANDLATCRMYRSNLATWNGFAKNAHEGLGSARGIVPWTVLLLGSLVIPWWFFSRIYGAIRYRESRLGAILHPLGIGLLIAIQWYALFRRIGGKPIGWKGRLVPA